MGHPFVQAMEEILHDDPEEVVAELAADKIESLTRLREVADQIAYILEMLIAA